MKYSENNVLAALEALLFIHGEPIAIARVAKLLGITAEKAKEALQTLEENLQAESRGFSLLLSGGRVQMVTKSIFSELVERFAKEELSAELTPASLEALSIISYFGPLSRNKVDFLRGVNSSFIVRSLLIRGLVEKVPDPQNAKIALYDASPECLRHLGLSRKEELPDFEKYRELLTKFESADTLL